ncbi:MAG: septum formation initiator family protein [Lachnospiraceae bacterium]|nr:septum formation initiator family protein [Lachnospiraceae bacterium]
MAKTPAFRKKKQNKFGCFCIAIVVGMLLVAVSIDGMRLQDKYNTYLSREEELTREIENEKKRTAELQEYEKYTKTKKFAEEIAESKLGLVHDGEVIFKPDEE